MLLIFKVAKHRQVGVAGLKSWVAGKSQEPAAVRSVERRCSAVPPAKYPAEEGTDAAGAAAGARDAWNVEVDRILPVFNRLHPDFFFPTFLVVPRGYLTLWPLNICGAVPQEGGGHAAGHDLAAALGRVPGALGRGAGVGGAAGLRLRGLEAALGPPATGPEDGALAGWRAWNWMGAV